MDNWLYLVNYYDGEMEDSFENADELIKYLKKKDEAGTLMGESAYGIFFGAHLTTSIYWKSAFDKED